jgi:DNA-binding phage protein
MIRISNVTLGILMTPGKDPDPPSDVEAFLSNPKTCALYLSDALETCQIAEISEALRDIRRANGSKVHSLTDGGHMHLAEIMDILKGAGICLVAVPVSPPGPE